MRPPGRWMASIFARFRGELTGIMRDSVAVKRSAEPQGKSAPEVSFASFIKSIDTAKRSDQPYRHWSLKACLPADIVDDILALPFEAPSLDGVSGKRELHNNTRKYFDVENRKRFPVCEAVAQAFQDKRVTSHIEKVFGTDLTGTYLRIEFAQDIDGFWLEPHTDLGVKVFTMLLYLSKDPSHPRSRHRHLRRRQGARRPLAFRVQCRHDLRAGGQYLSRLREAPDQGRAHLADHQLRHQ